MSLCSLMSIFVKNNNTITMETSLSGQNEFPKLIKDKSDVEGKLIINKQVKYSICEHISSKLYINTFMEISNNIGSNIEVVINEPCASYNVDFYSIEQMRLTAKFLLEVANKYEQLIKDNND